MCDRIARTAASALMAVGLLTFAGCASPLSKCASHLPKIDPTGQRIFTHDAPFKQVPGPIGHHDMTAVMVSPAKVIAPVGSEVVVQAAVCGQDRALMAGERVEWSIAPPSVGYFVQAGESGPLDRFHHVSYGTRKVDNTFAVSATSAKYIMLNRGTQTPDDDVPVLRGQAWTTVSSPVEGTTFITAVAPNVYAWDSRKQTATIYWIDAQWIFPPPAINPSGTRHAFTTTLVKHSNRCPLVGYRVRYEISGGPPAGFAPDGVQSIELPTNALGQATVEIFQTQPSAGTNTINISVIRPGDWQNGDGTPLVVGTGATSKTWTATTAGGLSIDKSGPSEVAVGGTATYRIVVRNPSDLSARGIIVTDQVPTGLNFVGSTPQATVLNNNLSWQLGDLAAGQSRQIELTFQATTPAVVNNCATVRTADGATAQDCVATTITQPLVDLQMIGPPQSVVGEEIVFTATITNRSSQPATGLVVTDRYDAGLRHDTLPNPIERDLGTLAPGSSQKINVRLRVTQPGRWCNTMDLSGDNGIRSSAQACTTAVQPANPVTVPPITPPPSTNNPPAAGQPVLTFEKTGPTKAAVGDTIQFRVKVVNTGNIAATNVKIVDTFDVNSLKAKRASEPFKVVGNTVIWELAELLPGYTFERVIECECVAPLVSACNAASVTCQEGVRKDSQTCLEITGVREPLTVTVLERREPVFVGNEVAYDVTIKNNAPVADQQVAVTVTLSNEMTPAAGSTGPTREPAVEGQGRTLRFAPLAELRPGESVTYQIRAVARQAGSASMRVDVTSTGSPAPLTKTETTLLVVQ